MQLSHFSVRGYRSFANEVVLGNLGRTVVLYGLNNAGKSNLLRALALFHRLMAVPLEQLLDETPRNAEAVYAELGEDAWMFNLDAGEGIELRGAFDADKGGNVLGFRIGRAAGGIRFGLSFWQFPVSSAQLLTPVSDNSGGLAPQAAQIYHRYRNALESETDERSPVLTEAVRQWQAVKEDWERLVAFVQPGLAVASSAGSSLPPELCGRMARLGRSLDRQRRRRSAWALERFGQVVTGLPPGRLEPVERAEDGGEDFGWVSESGVLPLDQLGSGARALFAVLATMALAEAPAVALEEPESHLNALLQRQLCAALAETMQATGEVGQLFIVTHSPSFADGALDLRLVERRDGVTTVHPVRPADLEVYRPESGAAQTDDTPSLLGYDGSVRLPAFVRDGLALEPGQFVYFVPTGNGEFRLVGEREMAAGLGEE